MNSDLLIEDFCRLVKKFKILIRRLGRGQGCMMSEWVRSVPCSLLGTQQAGEAQAVCAGVQR